MTAPEPLPANQQLNVLVLNTGKVDAYRRGDVDDFLIECLTPVVDAEGGPVPIVTGLHLELMFPRDENNGRANGAALFQLATEPGLSRHAFCLGTVAWDAGQIGAVWTMAVKKYRELRGALYARGQYTPAPMLPPPAPFMTLLLTPNIGAVKPEIVQAAARIQLALAWTLIETGSAGATS